MLGFGVSAIGRLGPTYYQNHKRLDDYYAALDAGRIRCSAASSSRPTTCCGAP
jgi:coproporphyrinogen III oxidase-like Fe-S oxidoreductase